MISRLIDFPESKLIERLVNWSEGAFGGLLTLFRLITLVASNDQLNDHRDTWAATLMNVYFCVLRTIITNISNSMHIEELYINKYIYVYKRRWWSEFIGGVWGVCKQATHLWSLSVLVRIRYVTWPTLPSHFMLVSLCIRIPVCCGFPVRGFCQSILAHCRR